jgi:GNAT superfamily N-acetyltransferase
MPNRAGGDAYREVKAAIIAAGFAFASPVDANAFKSPGGSTYPTYRRGPVTLALTTNPVFVYERNGRCDAWNGDPSAPYDDTITLDYLTTDPNSRGKGQASAALSDLCRVCDEIGVAIRLQPATPRRGRGGPSQLTSRQVCLWYARHGFAPLNEAAPSCVLIRQPVGWAGTRV